MAQLPTPPGRPGLARRLAAILFAGLAFVLALAMGLALFLPWDLIWPGILERAAARNPQIAQGGSSLEEPSALGFILRGVSANATGRVAVEAESVRVRLSSIPLLLTGLTARTGHTMVHLDQVRLEAGFSPLAVLRLTAGEELALTLIRNRTLVVGGKIDLAKLLPESRLAGTLGIYADLAWEEWRKPPASGSAEISATSLTLPDGRPVAGLAASASLEGNNLTLREFRMQQPVPLRGRGSAVLVWNNIQTSAFEFTGVAFPGLLDKPVERKGLLHELLLP